MKAYSRSPSIEDSALRHDQRTSLQALQDAGQARGVDVHEACQQPRPERGAGNGRDLDGSLVLPVEKVDACGQDRLDRVGNGECE